MIRLTQHDWRIFRRLQRKHKVSTEFLRYNLENIEKFIWFETWPRIIIKRYAVRKENRVFIIHYRLRRVLFDQSNRKMFKRKRQNIKQWSKRVVAYLRNHNGIKEYIEEVMYEERSEKEEGSETKRELEKSYNNSEDVSKQLKEQLELLKNGRRPPPLIPNIELKENQSILMEECTVRKDIASEGSIGVPEKQKSDSDNIDDVRKNLKELNNIRSQTNNIASLNMIKPQDSNDKDMQIQNPISEKQGYWQVNLESTPEKQITSQENIQPIKHLATDEKTEMSHTEDEMILPISNQSEKLKTGLNFLDMLMCKVSGSSISNNGNVQNNTNSNNNSNSINISGTKSKDNLVRMPSSSSLKEGYHHHHEHSMDSTDEFLGFDDCERIPGMLMTPIVPHSTKNNKNSVFVSESLNEYMRLNDLETNYNIDEDKSVIKNKIYARDMEGLMTPKTEPPPFDMPAVPENLLKFRTVAERKQYLQKFSKNYRLAIINNEAIIYRELQRRMRTQKVKSASQLLAQSSNSIMSFTRNGWNAASFINTEFNKYYYQVLDVDHGKYKVRLRGVRGNNDEFRKTPYVSRVSKPSKGCSIHCADSKNWQDLKPIKTIISKTRKLNKNPLPSVFKPCPLSHKTFQKPLDDDTAALLLAGGSMAVVRMPTVELEVFPELGKPLHEIAKRYLQYILPHHDISREWAEFSVSTLLQPRTLKEAEAAAKSFKSQDLRKSYTFVIPYLNDRSHILVRRVVDRSEKLDQSFEKCLEERELVPKTDFSFRQNLDESDDVLLTCADVVSDMINTVAISCSENSFIKNDPDSISIGEISDVAPKQIKQNVNGFERPSLTSPNTTAAVGGNAKKQKKQNSLLLELKRLNATIIDAAIKPGNEKKPCSKDYCQMGCVCVSLAEDLPIREHCGKTKCMLECNCKSSNQSRIMRLETDGRTITTEDAFMLRRKATARLARMEKEFTSTVVLTENETLLINETNNDKKRRCTKAPKRYEDFTDNEDEQRRNSPKKTGLTAIDNEKHLAVEIKELREPIYVKDFVLEQLKHCTVNLVPLQDMDNIVPWCMVHNLYKCFCKGRAVEGKPMIIEKEDVNTTIEHNGEQKLELDYNDGGRIKYAIEKLDKKKKVKGNDECDDGRDIEEEEDYDVYDKDQEDDDWIKEKRPRKKEGNGDKLNENNFVTEVKDSKSDNNFEQTKSDINNEDTVDDDHLRDSLVEQGRIEKLKPKRSLQEVRRRFYQSRPECCRRQIAIPRRMFLYCNRKRRLNVLKFIKDYENEETRLLLNEHVMRSVYYHKIDVENHNKNNLNSLTETAGVANKINCEILQSPNVPNNSLMTEKSNEIVDLLEDDDDEVTIPKDIGTTPLVGDKDENTQLSSTSTKSCVSFERLLPDPNNTDSTSQLQICSNDGVITVKKFSNLTDLNIDKNNAKLSTSKTTESEATIDELKLPKISSCFSLNVKANIQKPSVASISEHQQLDFTSVTSVHSAAFSQSQTQQAKRLPNSISSAGSTSKDGGCSLAVYMDNENIRDIYNSVIKTMNSLVSKKMQDIDCALQRESHIIPAPNADILCIMKWCNFLDAFCEGFAYIWQVKIKDETYFVVTIRNLMPLIAGAMGIVNITALKPDKMPLMGKMLLQKFRSKETEKLAVVMQGKMTHWVIKGFLRSEPNTACNKPTPESHPSLTKKINVLCSLLVKQRQRDQKKKEKSSNQWTTSQVATSTPISTIPQTQPPQVTPKIAQIMPIRRITIGTQATQSTPPLILQQYSIHQNPNNIELQNPPIVAQQQQQQQQLQANGQEMLQQNSNNLESKTNKQNVEESIKANTKNYSRKRKIDASPSNNLLKMDSYSKMSSNIEFRSVTQNDIGEIFLPELHKLDHKWLVLDLHNDFSHIFVPEFRDLVSLDRIQKVINFARQKNKIVKLQFFQNAPFDAFVTPKSGKKIYFGPLTMNMKSPTLILLQSVDGQMMLRELYQLQHNIVKKDEEKTKAFWLIHFKGQTHFEMDINENNKQLDGEILPNSSCSTATNKDTALSEITYDKEKNNINNNDDEDNEDDDEDCMIIDDVVQNNESSQNEPKDHNTFTVNSCRNDTVVGLTPQSNSLSVIPPIQPLTTSKTKNVNFQSESLLKVPNTNTIIKPLHPSNMATPVVINIPRMSVTNKSLPILTLPPNTIITGITPPSTSTTIPVPISIPEPSITTNIGNAVITCVQPAPPDASYSSTIFITSQSASSLALTGMVPTATTTTTAVNSITSISNSTESNEVTTVDLKSTNNKKQMDMSRQLSDVGAIKRRRISLFCSNKYDKMSENIAVDAVIKKILPDNAEDIQINPLTVGREEMKVTSTQEITVPVGTTQNSNLPANEANNLNTGIDSATPSIRKSSAPIVFDVNFMDDGDEPTASIVIKPSTSNATTITSSATTSLSTSSKSLLAKSGQIIPKSNANTTTNTVALNAVPTTAPNNKTTKLPTLYYTTATTSDTTTSTSGKGKLINSLLCTKQQTNIIPTFSTPKPAISKSSVSNVVSTISANSPTSNSTTVTAPFPLRRSSASAKVKKMIGSTHKATKTTTTTTNATSQLPLSAPVTVNQAQAMTNKPFTTIAVTSTVTTNLSQNSSLQMLPSIKATITPAKATTILTNSPITTASSVSPIPITSSTPTINSTITSNTESSLNPTLTISKVQSFGSLQKSNKTDINMQSFIPPQGQLVINDLNDRIILSLPEHIQYGYIVSASHANQKFVAKRVAEEFYVKVPAVGILKLQGLGAVNSYLNKYINKTLQEQQTTPAVWQFVAASKAIQLQNHQKSLLVRKTKTAGSSGVIKHKKVSPIKGNVRDNSLDEPILIDD